MKRMKLKLWRIERKLTQEQMAKDLETDLPRINQIELGKRDPNYKLLKKFKDVYKVDGVFELFEKEGE